MNSFKNREELLDLLLDDTQTVIAEIVKTIVISNKDLSLSDILSAIVKLEKLDSRIVNYRKMYPKE
jgi:hypothetical protein